MTPEERKMYLKRAWVGWRLLRSLALFMADERKRGTLKENLRSIRKARGLSFLHSGTRWCPTIPGACSF